MKTNPSHHPLVHTTHSADTVKLLLNYASWTVLLWLIGIQFMAGWHHSTLGLADYTSSFADGLGMVVVGAVVYLAAKMMHIKIEGVSGKLALIMGVILFAAAFPLAAALGSIWDAVGGVHPTTSGLPRTLAWMIAAC